MREHAALVLISLQTCGISPAANRNLVLTPLQAEGSGAISVMDKIQTNTDQNGNAWVSLIPGVYQTDVRPAWGQVGVTEFYFYVDPSNAVQSAFTNLLTATNNTYPPNQYAYSAQASDARYALLPVTSNDVASVNPGQIWPPLPNGITNNQTGVMLGGMFNGSFNGNGAGLTNVNASAMSGIPANILLNTFATSWMTNSPLIALSADMLQVNDGAIMSSCIDRYGNVFSALGTPPIWTAHGMDGYPAVLNNGGGLTNATVLGSSCTNAGTVFFLYRMIRPPTLSSFSAMISTGTNNPGNSQAPFAILYPFQSLQAPYSELLLDLISQGTSYAQFADDQFGDDIHVFCATWNANYYADFIDGKNANFNLKVGQGQAAPIPFQGWLYLGTDSHNDDAANFYWSEFWVYTNSLSFYAIDQMCNSFLKKIDRIRGTIFIFSDSMGAGADCGYGGTLQDYLAQAFPGWTIDNVSYIGGSSAVLLSNVLLDAVSSCKGGKNIGIWWPNLNNDGTGSNYSSFLAGLTNNAMIAAQVMKTNNIMAFLVDPPSNPYTDTNGERFAYENWATNCYTNYFTDIIDLSKDPNFGQTNQFTNTVYYPISGSPHGTNVMFSEIVQSFAAPIINAHLNNIYFVNSTTAPPPTVGQPWIAQDMRAPGRFFSNSNGVWASH
ncbi:MAG TPA: hypothetical protein VK811_02965 [Candidatus Acidoferrum sp.]|nr:hypothetical protein [Candidatus Acidoferrum sp.]